MTEPPPEGWYPDPAGGGGLRWWTGVTWTSDTRSTAPLAPSAPPTPTATAGPSTAWSPVVPEPDDDIAPPVLASRYSRRARWVAAAVVVLLLGVIGAGAVAASLASRNRLDIGAVESEIAAQITATSGLHTTVVCPGPIDIAAGTTFTCQATTDDGVSTEVTVHQDDDQGNLTFGLPQ